MSFVRSRRQRSGERGEVRADGALALPLDVLGTNLLAAEVGGRDGGFELRHDRFRDAVMREARKAGYTVRREFSFGSMLSEAHAVLLRGAAAVAVADADAGVPDDQLDDVAREARRKRCWERMLTVSARAAALRAVCARTWGCVGRVGRTTRSSTR